MMRTLHENLKPMTIPFACLNALAQELSWIRAAGFATCHRFDRFTRLMLRTADRYRINPTECYERVVSLSLEIQADDAKQAAIDLAIQSRRKAV